MKHMNLNKRLLTASELADDLRIGRTTLWRLRKQQDFPAPMRVGNTLRWDAREVEKWLESQREELQEAV
jgi:excisionase family DNA binding protein